MELKSSGQQVSSFSYNLTHRYPFPWFTWVTVIGGILATVLFSAINLAATGYVPETVHTGDPSSTASMKYWFQNTPFSWANKQSPTCQAEALTVGNEYFTTNLGLIYKLDKIWQYAEDGTRTLYPALPYMNSNLEHCTVPLITIEMGRLDTSQGSGSWWSWANSYAFANAQCIVQTADKSIPWVYIDFIATLPLMSQSCCDNVTLDGFLNVDNQTQPSIFWGAHLLNAFYVRISEALASLPAPDPFHTSDTVMWDSGEITIQRNPEVSDITSFDFFESIHVFRRSDGLEDYHGNWDYEPMSWWRDGNWRPELSSDTDILAKSLYSTILCDLGQRGESNGLADDRSLKYLYNYTAHNTSAQSFYDEAQSTVPPLQVYNATIFARYVCSVPKRKDAGSLIVSILVADLVFLQASWTILNWIATFLLQRKDSKMNLCEGCQDRKYHPLLQRSRESRTSSDQYLNSIPSSALQDT